MSDGRIIEVRKRPTISEKRDAAELALAYLEGRPHQTAVVAHADLGPAELDDQSLRLRVGEILAKFATGADKALPEGMRGEVIDVEPSKVEVKR